MTCPKCNDTGLAEAGTGNDNECLEVCDAADCGSSVFGRRKQSLDELLESERKRAKALFDPKTAHCFKHAFAGLGKESSYVCTCIGSFAWAMQQILAGNCVRHRYGQWFYLMRYGRVHMRTRKNGSYHPGWLSQDDLTATDWELVDEPST